MTHTICENCRNYVYDEETDCMICEQNLDEDEMRLFLICQTEHCPYYDFDDEYAIVRKQN